MSDLSPASQGHEFGVVCANGHRSYERVRGVIDPVFADCRCGAPRKGEQLAPVLPEGQRQGG